MRTGPVEADRDRGAPHGAAPPTPPGIRVRTTAVRPGERSWPLETRQSKRVEVGDGQCPAERGGTSGAPRTAITASREDSVLRIHPALPQLTEARARPVPLRPHNGAEAPPYPLVKTSENRGRLAKAEIRPPSEQVRGQLPHHVGEADASYPSGQHPNSLPKPDQRGGGHTPLRPRTGDEAEAQKRPHPGRRHRTLRHVDLELEPPGDEACDASHHTLSRPLASDIHVAVVSVSHKAVTPAFQLAVQSVEHDVRQHW